LFKFQSSPLATCQVGDHFSFPFFTSRRGT
jgi:hypothetical protein